MPARKTGTETRAHGARVASLELALLEVALHEPFQIAVGVLEGVQNVLVRLTLEDGTMGLGEAAPFPSLTGETQATVAAAVNGMAGLIEGSDATDFRGIHRKLLGNYRTQTSARAAVESALFDALARRHGVPLHRWFGGRGRELVTDLTIPIVGTRDAARLARRVRDLGIGVVKTKVGNEVEADVARVRAIRRAHPGCGLVLDANQGYTPKEALRFLSELGRAGIEPLLMEQPVHREDLAGMAFVRERTHVPVYADESVFEAADAWRILSEGAADGVNIKLAKCGGLVEAMDIAALCRAAGGGLMIGAMVETRLGLTAAAHFAAGTGGFRFVDLDTHMLMASDPFEGGFEQEGGKLTLSDAPGLGIRVRD